MRIAVCDDEKIFLGSLDRLKDNIQSKTELQSKQAEKYTLQAEEYECSLQLYTERLYSQADVLDKRIAAYDNKIKAANEQLRIKSELYDSGMILEYELTEAKVTLKELEAERT